MDFLLIGNIVSFVGASFMILIGLIRKKQNILIAQCAQFGIMGVGQLFLGGITGAVSNGVSILRNLICLKFDFTLPFKMVFMVLQVVLTLLVRPIGVIAWFPTVAACLYTWFLDSKNEVVLKTVMIAGQLLWIAYDASIRNYSALAFDIFTVISTVVGIFLVKKNQRS